MQMSENKIFNYLLDSQLIKRLSLKITVWRDNCWAEIEDLHSKRIDSFNTSESFYWNKSCKKFFRIPAF